MKKGFISTKKRMGGLLLLLLFSSFTVQQVKEGELVNVPGTAVSLVPPRHFVLTKHFAGFIHDPTNTSIAVAKVPNTSYIAFRKSVNNQYFTSQKLTLLEKEEIKTEHIEGVLYHLAFTVKEVEMERYMLITGDYNDTYVVMSNYPVMFKSQVSGLIKKSLKTVRYK